jgi:hypothetical protein
VDEVELAAYKTETERLKAENARQFALLESLKATNEKQSDMLKETVSQAAPAKLCKEVRTLVQPLQPVETMARMDDALAKHLNEGWEVLNCSIQRVENLVRIVTLVRDVPAKAEATLTAHAEALRVTDYSDDFDVDDVDKEDTAEVAVSKRLVTPVGPAVTIIMPPERVPQPVNQVVKHYEFGRNRQRHESDKAYSTEIIDGIRAAGSVEDYLAQSNKEALEAARAQFEAAMTRDTTFTRIPGRPATAYNPRALADGK